MKKRLISLLLTLSMVFSMVPMLGIGVGAIGYSHNASNMCYLIPYAYYANKYSSHEYFIAHYNINGALNATNLESSFNNSVTTGIANSLDEASWIEKSSEACVQLLQKVFNPTGDFTVTDLYDTLLINMLLDKAATTLSDSTGTIKDIASSTTGLLSTTVKVVDAGGSGVADAISFHQLLTSLGDDGWTAFKNTLKADYFEASNFDIYNIKIGGKTAYVEANVIDNFIQHSSRGKVSVKSIEETFDMLNNCMTAVNKLSEVADMYSNALLIKQSVTTDAATLLEKMQDETDSLFLSTAINKYINLINSGDIDAFMTAVLAKQATEYTVELLVDCMKKALEKNPVYKAGQCVFTIADFISNFDDQGTFSEKSEMLFVLHSLVTIDTAVIEAMKSIEQECIDDYEDIDSVNMCNAYITGMLMSYRLQSVELDYGQKYMTVWYGEKEFEKLLGNSEAWEQWETSIERQKNHLDSWKPLAFTTGDGTGKTNSIMTWYNRCMDVINKGTEIYYVSEGSIFTQQTKPYGQKIQITDSVPVREGYAFSGWRNYSVTCQPKEELDQYLKGTKYELNPCFCGNELWLNAKWDDIDAITYIADKATNVPASHENKGVLSNQVPRKNGYDFLGWDEDPNVKNPTYKAGDPISKTGDVTLYAIWNKVVFNIIFDADGPDGDGGYFPTTNTTTITKTKPYGEAFVIDVEKPVRPGYIFADQWTHLNPKTGRVEPFDHDPNKTIYDIGDETTIDKVLYPVWADASATMVYDHGDWIVNPDNPNESIVEHADPIEVDVSTGTTYALVDPVIPSYNGNSFKGWQYYKNGGPLFDMNGYAYTLLQVGDTIELDPTDGVENYVLAKWQYYVHYNSGSEVVREQGVNDYVIKAPAVTYNSDQVFKYWNHVDEEGNTTKYYAGDVIDLTSDLTLTAVWGTEDTVNTILTVLTDKASYEPGDTVKIEIIADNSGYFRVDASDNDGFKLENAEGRKKTSGVFVESSSKSDADDLKCYDNGESYTVELYIPDDCENGTYPIDIFASNGIYDEDSDGSVTGTETSTASETLSVKVDNGEEEVATYILSYNINNGYGATPESVEFRENQDIELADDSGFQRVGYNFIGWTTDIEGDGKLYKAGREYTFDESTILYAQWEVDEDYEAGLEDLYIHIWDEDYSTKTGVNLHKPGDTAYIFVDIRNSDHFFFDVRECPGATFTGSGGFNVTNSTFYEESSPDVQGTITYVNQPVNGAYAMVINVEIPEDCEDGEYTFFATAAKEPGNPTPGPTTSASVTITVRESDDADAVHLNKSTLTVHEGDDKRIEATIVPSYFIDKRVKWTTSDDDVASIDAQGNRVYVTGVSSGTATVTASCDGVSASCKVTVVECDYTEKVIDDEHLASPATCTEQATYYYECSCGDISRRKTFKAGSPAGHSYSDWETVTEATETTSGLKQRTCSECGDIESEAIPATGHITHTPDNEWHTDENNHWHECTNDNCDELLDKAAHADEDGDGKCDECDYVVETEEPHEHEPVAEWKSDETYHWHECTGEDCDELLDKAAHADEDGDGKCDECDYVVETEEPHEHEPAAEWKSDEAYHWHECTGEDCDELLDKVAHADEDGDGKCDECDYVVETEEPHEHEPAAEWKSDETYHWHECTGEDCDELLDKAAHADEDGDGKCDECDYVVETEEPHEHEPADEWNSDETYHWHECTGEDCDEILDKARHTASDWIVDEKATEKHDGLQHKECTVCGYILDVETIPALKSDFNSDEWYRHMMILMNQKYTITANAGEGGSISNEGRTTVKFSNNITYTITPDEGYEIEAVYVDNVDVGAVESYTFKRVNKDHTIHAVFAEIEEESIYADIEADDWFYDDVVYVTGNGLMNGTGDNKFSPDVNTTRAMIVTILWRLEGEAEAADAGFTDVAADMWYTEAIDWAAANGIVNGFGDGTFGPEKNITREQVMAILHRYAAYKGWDDGLAVSMIPQFDCSVWAENDVNWADMNGLLDNLGVDVIDMTAEADRAEIAAYLRRFCENIVE